MADTFTTVADLVKLNDKNANDFGMSDLFDDAPFIKALAFTPASNGTKHQYLKESGAPTVGFRAANTGIENSVSVDTQVSADLKILDASFSVDKAVADAYYKGPEAWIQREAKRHLKAALFAAEMQFLNGSHADGFVGFKNSATLDGLADTYVLNAGGTTAATASSVYLIRTNDDGTDTMGVIGNNGEIKIDETVITTIPQGTGRFTAYHTPIIGWLGMQYGAVYSVVRIVNLTEDAGKGLTDALIAKALEKFPASRQPNLIVGNRRSRRQLHSSRTAMNATGAAAPIPTESFGIPYVCTDAILSTEALVA